jgi:hypothetical protein
MGRKIVTTFQAISGSFASVMIYTCDPGVAVKAPGSVMYNGGLRDALELAG